MRVQINGKEEIWGEFKKRVSEEAKEQEWETREFEITDVPRAEGKKFIIWLK